VVQVFNASKIVGIGKITKKLPFLHRLLVTIYHLIIFEVWPRFKRIREKDRANTEKSSELNEFLSLQALRILRFDLPTPTSDQDLIEILKGHDIPFFEGGWTIYLPPSNQLIKYLPQLSEYPKSSGVKFLRDLKPPESASYTPHQLNPAPGAARIRARTPDPKTLLRLSGHLYLEGIGPLVHDLVEIRIGDKRCSAFIISHISKDTKVSEVSDNDYKRFITKLDKVLAKGVLDISHGNYKISKDFSAPDCNNNLIKSSDGKMVYVDVQSFCFKNENKALIDWSMANQSQILFGPRRIGKSENYLYQMIPGVGDAKRGTTTRWNVLDELIQKADLEFTDRIAFDIGCNTGLMSYYALSKGAKWAYGWDKEDVANASHELLKLLGASRWTPVGGKINEDTDFKSSLHGNHQEFKEGILLYLAISKHIGFPQNVAELPWKYCVYEGHSNQDIDYSIKMIRNSKWAPEIQIMATGAIRDGDSPTRSIVIFCR